MIVCGNCGAVNDHATYACRKPKALRPPASKDASPPVIDFASDDGGRQPVVARRSTVRGRGDKSDGVQGSPAAKTPLIAPKGQCRFCDARREYARLAMKKSYRKKSKQKDPI